VVNIAFGVMTRAAPQLNIFSIGFPLDPGLGMGIFWIGLADILNQYQRWRATPAVHVIWHGRAEPWPRARVVRTKQKTPRRSAKGLSEKGEIARSKELNTVGDDRPAPAACWRLAGIWPRPCWP
jgi:hypothetical protein